MHIVHNKIWVPKIAQKNITENISSFTVWPLPRWYGVTLWNSLRRVLLSSIPWTKVTWIRVAGVSHEYSSLPGVKDSVVDMMLNLKGLIIDKVDTWIEWLKIKKNTAWLVTAWDIHAPAWVKILNPELYITEIDKDGMVLDIEIRIEKSVGYISIEELKEREDDVHMLLIDANFSPIENVKYTVASTRVEDVNNLDSLEIEITTTGVISPEHAIKFAGDMLMSYFSLFNEEGLQVDGQFIADVKDLLQREKRK